MAIDFECRCGKKLKSKDEFAGKRTKCPVCGEALVVPQTAAALAAAERAAKAAPTPSAFDEPLAIDMGESAVKIEPISSPSTATLETVPHMPALADPAAPPQNGDARQYKVLSSKDMGFFAKFDSAKLEETLNAWSRQGWSVRSVLTMTHTSHSGPINDLLVILER